ncbi:hypothetical protein Hanom_Chr07g00638741 [Helianthus anomalus]
MYNLLTYNSTWFLLTRSNMFGALTRIKKYAYLFWFLDCVILQVC